MTATLDSPPASADLVTRSLAGDRQAFAAIVRDNQSLICSIAYAATGSIPRSEDISQEVFVAAWTQLRQLREPTKLRSWLCGIARNLIQNTRRRHARETLTPTPPDLADPAPTPPQRAISNEEQALLWRALGRIPDDYREPLVLFYRRQQSIVQIADALALSEDAVKQRLSRGRKLLQSEMESFVASALQRSAPGAAFTASVLASLPAAAAPATAATVSASASTKAATLLKITAVLASPILIVIGYWAAYRMGIESAHSDGERDMIRGFYLRILFLVLTFGALLTALCFSGGWLLAVHPAFFTAIVLALVIGYCAATVLLALWAGRRRRLLRHRRAADGLPPVSVAGFEYRSRHTLLGLPLIHLRFSSSANQAPVRAWIAVGDDARGLLLAFGGRATAPLAIGGCATGIIAFGGLAIGCVSLGGLSLGLFALGGLAGGYDAFGGLAVALHDGLGGIVLAHHAALGALAQAPQANTPTAEALIGNRFVFRAGSFLSVHAVPLNLLWVVPLLVFWYRARKHRVRP
ncbi:MAG TPA: sigma-70 family RNA polymerase sigma factor [Phycisphaerae bacterium]|nr:sigma-70 family RNA polymerase sigma factor [Phycisphaerae bacterium]